MTQAEMFKKRLDWIELIIALAVLIGAWMYVTRPQTEAVAAVRTAPEPNSLAPDFSLPMLDGRRIALKDLRGQVVLVNFWATWCVPCRAEMPEIQRAYEKYRDKKFMVLAVNTNEDAETASQFVQQLQLTFPILLDQDGRVAAQYRIAGLPTSFFIDREGIIRRVAVGQMPRSYIESLLTEILGISQ